MRRPVLYSPRALFLAGAIPVLVAAVAYAGGLYFFLEELEARTWSVARNVALGTASPAEIGRLSAWMRQRLVLGFVFHFVLLGGAVALLATASYQVRARLRRLVEFVDRRPDPHRTEERMRLDSSALGDVEARIERLLHDMADRERYLENEMSRRRLEAQVQRALEMSEDEHDVYETTLRAMRRVLPGAPLQLLVADSSRSHLRTAFIDGAEQGCPVPHPRACPAIREGRARTFLSSDDIDACPRLREHPARPCAAICLPVNVMGRAVGVLHAFPPEGQLPREEAVQVAVTIAANAGARMGMLRTLETTQLQANTDPLTGLLNRRSFESRAREALRQWDRAAIVLGDLDHFKRLNDTHGHQAGDRALRLFAHTLARNLKREDLVSRYGGEEFVAFLGGCSPADAVRVMERVRASLREALERSVTPHFTVSFGIACAPEHGTDLDTLLHLADRAMYAAKTAGRDRIVVAGTEDGEPDREAA